MKTLSHLQAASNSVDVTSYIDYRAYLDAIYNRIKEQKKGSYSYVRFSEDLNLGTSNMVHLCVRGKRHFRSSSIETVASALGLTGSAREFFRTLYKYTLAKLPDERESLMRDLVAQKRKSLTSLVDQCFFEYYSEWFHPVVRELAVCSGFDGSAQWIVDHLEPRITVEQAQESLALLQRLGFLVTDSTTRKLVQHKPALFLTDNIRSLSLVRYHQGLLEIAKQTLVSMSEEKRDIRAFTLSVPASAIPQIRAEIARFQDRIVEIATSEEKADNVLQINLQFFPFAENTGEKR